MVNDLSMSMSFMQVNQSGAKVAQVTMRCHHAFPSEDLWYRGHRLTHLSEKSRSKCNGFTGGTTVLYRVYAVCDYRIDGDVESRVAAELRKIPSC